jgi:hypothetical protein
MADSIPQMPQENAAIDLQSGMSMASYPFSRRPSVLSPQNNPNVEQPPAPRSVRFPAVITSNEARRRNERNMAWFHSLDSQMRQRRQSN